MHLEARKATSREGGFDHRREPFLLVPVPETVSTDLSEADDDARHACTLRDV